MLPHLSQFLLEAKNCAKCSWRSDPDERYATSDLAMLATHRTDYLRPPQLSQNLLEARFSANCSRHPNPDGQSANKLAFPLRSTATVTQLALMRRHVNRSVVTDTNFISSSVLLLSALLLDLLTIRCIVISDGGCYLEVELFIELSKFRFSKLPAVTQAERQKLSKIVICHTFYWLSPSPCFVTMLLFFFFSRYATFFSLCSGS